MVADLLSLASQASAPMACTLNHINLSHNQQTQSNATTGVRHESSTTTKSAARSAEPFAGAGADRTASSTTAYRTKHNTTRCARDEAPAASNRGRTTACPAPRRHHLAPRSIRSDYPSPPTMPSPQQAVQLHTVREGAGLAPAPIGATPQQDPSQAKLLERGTTSMKRRRGKVPRSGLDYRVATDEETAIEAALRTAPSRKGEPIFYPYKGTTFNSREEAWHFYTLYSWKIGFGIRKTDARTNKEGYTTKQDLVCSCEGLDKNPNSASSRTGCKAMIRLLRRGRLLVHQNNN
ncbi:unnamed protein product [Urochloa humidicola]